MGLAPDMSAYTESSAVAGYMSVTLFIGDAIRQASPEQRERIREEVLPSLHLSEVPIRDVLMHVIEIMGTDWELQPESQRWIQGLLS